MNFIVGVIVIISKGNLEESDFLATKIFCEMGASELYLPKFPLVSKFLVVFHRTLKKLKPDVESNLRVLDIHDSLWVTKWFLTFFAKVLSFGELLRLFDCILAFGLKFLIKFALAIVIFHSKEFLLTDPFDLLEFLASISLEKLNIEDLIQLSISIELSDRHLKQYIIKR